MLLYYCLTAWFFIILLLGLRPDSIRAVECWPERPSDNLARINKIIVSIFVWSSFFFAVVFDSFSLS